MGEYHIKNFENFIHGCNSILDNAAGDLITWQPHFDKAEWEKISFYGCNRMQKGAKAWREDGTKICTDAHLSKSQLLHIILVNGNIKTENHVRKNIVKLFNRIEEFKVTNKMYNVNIAPKNHWFINLHRHVKEYKAWFDETFTSNEKATIQESKGKGSNAKLSLPEIGILCFYNKRVVSISNDIAIAEEYGITTKKHTVNEWCNKADSKDLWATSLEKRHRIYQIHRLENIYKSGYLNDAAQSNVEKAIKALKDENITEYK